MKTFENLDGLFVDEDPGLENTIFGHDKNGVAAVLGSILYWDYGPSECYFTRVDEYNWNWINHNLRQGYIVISEEDAEIISRYPNHKCYGQWRARKNRY